MKHIPLNQWPKQAFAGFWIRFLAYLIDWLMIGAISKILFNLTLHRWYYVDDLIDIWWYKLIKLSIVVLYFVTTMWLLNGQTIGKNLLGLQVRSANADMLDKNSLLIRETAGRIILYYFPILAISLVFTSQRQHLIDLFCDTVVINERSVNALDDFLAQEQGYIQ